MKIGIIIGRIGGVDGVALETEKWIDVLQELGHEIFILAGQFEKSVIATENEDVLSTLSFFSPECVWEQSKAFHGPDPDLGYLLEGIERESEFICKRILSWLTKNEIDIFLSENSSALPCHLSMGLGIKKAVLQSGITTVSHDHDYAWERGGRYISPHIEVNQLIEATFPLRAPNVRHAVINQEAKRVLKRSFSIDATVVPNVMDFDKPFALEDEYNSTLREDLRLKDGNIILLQPTRVVRRKGIETAIQLIHELKDEKLKLIITGSHADDDLGRYFSDLMELVHKLNLSRQVYFASTRIRNDRYLTPDGHKVYNLSDIYAYGRACTYFSTYEGFGNAFLEAVLAKKPIFVNNYLPVYWPDIGSKGFKTVMLEGNDLTAEALEQIRKIVYDEKLCKEIGDFNFTIGKKFFSYDVLREKLAKLFKP